MSSYDVTGHAALSNESRTRSHRVASAGLAEPGQREMRAEPAAVHLDARPTGSRPGALGKPGETVRGSRGRAEPEHSRAIRSGEGTGAR